jgi:hypothetical protein
MFFFVFHYIYLNRVSFRTKEGLGIGIEAKLRRSFNGEGGERDVE